MNYQSDLIPYDYKYEPDTNDSLASKLKPNRIAVIIIDLVIQSLTVGYLVQAYGTNTLESKFKTAILILQSALYLIDSLLQLIAVWLQITPLNSKIYYPFYSGTVYSFKFVNLIKFIGFNIAYFMLDKNGTSMALILIFLIYDYIAYFLRYLLLVVLLLVFKLFNRYRRRLFKTIVYLLNFIPIIHNGLKPENLAKFIQLNQILYDDKQKEKYKLCAICINEYEENDLLIKLECKHYYHKECIHSWLKIKNNCPTCRTKV
jgi:hypothetical protein